MIRMLSIIPLFLTSLALGAPASIYKMKQLGSGYLECPPGLRVSPKGKKIYCDISAAVYANGSNSVYYAADWWKAPNLSKLFSMQWKNGKPLLNTRKYHASSKDFVDAEKIEAMTKTEKGQFLIASAAFTHTVLTGYAGWAKINNLTYWKDGDESGAKKNQISVLMATCCLRAALERRYTQTI